MRNRSWRFVKCRVWEEMPSNLIRSRILVGIENPRDKTLLQRSKPRLINLTTKLILDHLESSMSTNVQALAEGGIRPPNTLKITVSSATRELLLSELNNPTSSSEELVFLEAPSKKKSNVISLKANPVLSREELFKRFLSQRCKSYILECLNEYRKRCLVFYLLNFANEIKFEGVSRRSNQNALTVFRRPKLIFDYVTKTTKNRSLSRLNTEVAIYFQVNFQEFYISFLLRPKTIIADVRLMNEKQFGGKVNIEDFLDSIRKLGNKTLLYQNVFIESSVISENVAVDTSQNNTAMTKGFTEVSKGYNFYITNEFSY
ncbi:hypothetical protein ACOME3_005341 [Neoechinorhynchus agilis]